MECPFKKATNEVMEILPVEEIMEEEDDDVGNNGEINNKNVKLDVKESDVFRESSIISPIIDEKPSKVRDNKTKVGERGVDKVPRKKRVMTAEGKEKLKKARELSLQSRRAIKTERDLLRKAEKQTALDKLAVRDIHLHLKHLKWI